MGKFIISYNEMSKGRAGSRCSMPGLWLHLPVSLFVLPSLMFSILLRLTTKLLRYFQVSHADTTMSRETEGTFLFSNKLRARFSQVLVDRSDYSPHPKVEKAATLCCLELLSLEELSKWSLPPPQSLPKDKYRALTVGAELLQSRVLLLMGQRVFLYK